MAIRTLRSNKGYSFINITGLSIGLACCILILLWVNDELSYDRYHENAERIFRVVLRGRMSNRDINFCTSPAPLAKTLIDEFPEVRRATRFLRYRNVLVSYQEKNFNESLMLRTDPNFFDVFSIPLIKGDSREVLCQPNSVVITKKAAHKYFGGKDPLGQILTFDNQTDFCITGLAENVPPNTHFHSDFFVSIDTIPYNKNQNWFSNPYHTYIVLDKETSSEEFQAKLPMIITKYMGPLAKKVMGVTLEEYSSSGDTFGYFLQPVTRIHLHSDMEYELEPNGSITYIYLFSSIAFFILMIACVNFMNLATARSACRAKEVGVRKALGSDRLKLIKQFLTESMLLSSLSLVSAVLIAVLLQSVFSRLSGKPLHIASLFCWTWLPGALAVIFFMGIFAGSYPAFYLSTFQPIYVLRGTLKVGIKSFQLRSGLVVFQFIISTVMLVGTLVVHNQLEYMRNIKLGFDEEQLLIIQRAEKLGWNKEAFKNELLSSNEITEVAFSNSVPGRQFGDLTHLTEGNSSAEMMRMFYLDADFDYINTLRLDMIEGRYFSKDRPADRNSVVINETALAELGIENPLGKRLIRDSSIPGEKEFFTIIGIVKDFHFESLHQKIRPLALYLLSEEDASYVSIRIRADDIPQTLALIKSQWSKMTSEQYFDYFFLDDHFGGLYKSEEKVVQLFSAFTVLAVLVACLGLFGLASFTTEQRTKEIGIRRVLGARPTRLFALLTKEFSRWILLANLIAWPIAYLVMNPWLQNFPYHTDIKIWIFILAALMTFFMALLTISYHTLRSVAVNPVDTLKHE